MTNVDSLQNQNDLLASRNSDLSDELTKVRAQRDDLLDRAAKDNTVITACIREAEARDEFENDATSLSEAAYNAAVINRRHAIMAWKVERG